MHDMEETTCSEEPAHSVWVAEALISEHNEHTAEIVPSKIQWYRFLRLGENWSSKPTMPVLRYTVDIILYSFHTHTNTYTNHTDTNNRNVRSQVWIIHTCDCIFLVSCDIAWWLDCCFLWTHTYAKTHGCEFVMTQLAGATCSTSFDQICERLSDLKQESESLQELRSQQQSRLNRSSNSLSEMRKWLTIWAVLMRWVYIAVTSN